MSGMMIGNYRRYAGVDNDWHIGSITQDGTGYRWTYRLQFHG
jgi:hypothetical protein